MKVLNYYLCKRANEIEKGRDTKMYPHPLECIIYVVLNKSGGIMRKDDKKRRLIDSKKIALMIGLIFVVIAIVAANYIEVRNTSFSGTYAEFREDAQKGTVDYIRFSGSSQTVDAFLSNGKAYSFWTPRNAEFYEFITKYDIEVKVRNKTVWDAVIGAAISLPFVLFAALIGFVMISMVGSYTIATTGIELKKNVATRFKDIGGLTKVKQEISYIVELLNGKIAPTLSLPRGILFYGPPGTGKTLLAKAIAGEANVPFVALNGADLSANMFAGVGAAKIKRLYEVAQANSPALIFIDEIDVVGAKRSVSDSGVSKDQNATLTRVRKIILFSCR